MSTPRRYPVDRYLDASNKTFGKINILNDDLWNSDPVLRPEDEIILRKLQEMLQSTAEDLKLLSREINMNKEPRVHVKTLPTPLDEEFNEKVHIQEIVDAKFNGYNIVEPYEKDVQSKFVKNVNKIIKNNISYTNVGDKQNNTDTISKKQPIAKVLRQTKVRTIDIDEDNKNLKSNLTLEKKIEKPTIAYNEYYHKYTEPKEEPESQSSLKVQHMPSVNIRSELKEQKVLQLDIVPESTPNEEITQQCHKNVSVIAIKHETKPINTKPTQSKIPPTIQHVLTMKPHRKVTKMSTCDSSDSGSAHLNKKIQIKPGVRSTPTNTARNETVKNKYNTSTAKTQKINKNLEAWKKKLNRVYGQSNKSPNKRPVISTKKKPSNPYKSPARTPQSNIVKSLNNAQYIPYSKLTIGGVRASDIENEIGNIAVKGNTQISPIIDKILSSRDHSFNDDNKNVDSAKVLDTSDERLLQEVIDIEKTVSNTLILNGKTNKDSGSSPEIPKINVSSASGSDENYDDDFEDDDRSENEVHKSDSNSESKNSSKENMTNTNEVTKLRTSENTATDIQNKSSKKSLNLSYKNPVDIFEFIHSIDTQEIATQSYPTTHKISLKETQTSPKHAKTSSPPPQIHNELWPTIDPKGKVKQMFKLEKELIKKLILEEYGDLLESNISKPSTSNDKSAPNQLHANVISTQKLTQTSPAKVKSAMTSPKTTKTRMTSPFVLSLAVDQQTSPLEGNFQEALKIELDNSVEDLGISINLSSPRFSLRLPQNSHEVLSNLEICSQTFIRSPNKKTRGKHTTHKMAEMFTKCDVSSSSSEEFNSSDISSLGEVTLKLRKKLKSRVPTISESSSSSQKSSSDLQSCGVLPLRSEGEVSLGQVPKKQVPLKSYGDINSKTREKR